MICAACPADLAGHPVTVIRTVIVNRAAKQVRICVPCDQAIPVADLRWYREDTEATKRS